MKATSKSGEELPDKMASDYILACGLLKWTILLLE
jgi:hypothetical protein